MHISVCNLTVFPFPPSTLPPFTFRSKKLYRAAAPQSPHVCRHCLFYLVSALRMCRHVAIFYCLDTTISIQIYILNIFKKKRIQNLMQQAHMHTSGMQA